jgi:hypothetical protein
MKNKTQVASGNGETLTLEGTPIKKNRAGIIARVLHGTGAGVVAYGLGIANNLRPYSLHN